ncbi:MAG TPA: response regulator transcription factor [Bacillota bacterium]|nr:response regulator transcription factor [Bacillota bacterium]
MEKILVIEDDVSIVTLLTFHLEKEGYTVTTATDGLEGLNLVQTEKPNFILLDLMLPGMDGIEICKALRMERIYTPILILTAKDDLFDKVLSLELGADDYITKPFNIREVMARIKAILRRTKLTTIDQLADTSFQVGPLKLSIENYEAAFGDRRLNLTRREFELLLHLVKNQGTVLTRDQLLQDVWSYDSAGDSRIVDVHISHLREKIELDTKQPKYIRTIRGKGYKFEVTS